MSKSVKAELTALLIKIAVCALALAAFGTLVYGVHRTNRMDMYPSVKPGDLIIYDRLNTKAVKDDVIIALYEQELILSRVVATAGDEVDIREDGLYINGYRQQERDISEDTRRYESGVKFPLTVGEGEIFVLGDKRESATDSRIFGSIETKGLKGKVRVSLRRRGI